MNRRLAVVRLALELTVRGGRSALRRTLTIAAGPAIGVAAVLLALGYVNANSVLDRKEASVRPDAIMAGDEPRGGTLMWNKTGVFHGEPFTTSIVARDGAGPTPPGLEQFPAPGEALLSPALAAELDGPDAEHLIGQLRARPVGEIAEVGLARPSDRIAYVGLDASARERAAYGLAVQPNRFDDFAGESSDSIGVRVVLVLVTLAVGVPVVLLVLATTRLSAASRAARIASLSLAGASRADVRLILATEATLAAVVGSVIGVGLAHVGRSLLFLSPGFSDRWYLSAYSWSPAAALAVVAGTIGVVAVASLWGLRRITDGAVLMARSPAASRPRTAWVLVLALGLIGLIAAGIAGGALAARPVLALLVLGGSMLLVLVGTAGVSQWLVVRLGEAVARRGPTPSLQLASRRLASSPTTMLRVCSVIAVFTGVCIVGVGVGAAAVDQDEGVIYPGIEVAQDEVIVTTTPAVAQGLEGIEGVDEVRATGVGPFGGTKCKRYECAYVVRTDGAASTVERVRAEMSWKVSFVGSTEEAESVAGLGRETPAALTMLRGAVLVVLVLSVAALFVSSFESTTERRQGFSLLSAFGYRLSFLRRSIAVETVVPIVLSAVLGLVCGWIALWAFSSWAEQSFPLPLDTVMTNLGTLGAATAVVAVIAVLSVPTRLNVEDLRST